MSASALNVTTFLTQYKMLKNLFNKTKMKYFYFFFAVLVSSYCLLAQMPKDFREIVQNTSTSASNEEVETSPLMMFGGEKGKTIGEKKENSATPKDPRDEYQNFSSDDSSNVPSGELSNGNGIAERDEKDEDVVTLEHFKQAVEAYPTAARLIIEEEGGLSIQPQEPRANRAGSTGAENRKILKTLKRLIANFYGPDLAESIPQLNALALLRADPLGSENLRAILTFLETNQNEASEFALEPRFRQQERLIAQQKEEFQQAPTEENLLSPSADSVFAAPLFLQEKARIGEIMKRMIKISKSEREWKDYYKDVDELWEQSQKAWEERTMATWKVEATKQSLAQAEELLRRAKTVLENTDLNTTTLGRISSLTGQASDMLSKVPNEYAQVVAGFMGTISAGAGVANQLRAQAPVTMAEVTRTLADQRAKQAEEIRNQANQAAPDVQKTAEKMEAQAREQESAARKELIERLEPPVTNLTEKEWLIWATLLVQAGKGNPLVIPLLAEHGLLDPLGAAEMILGAWSEAEEESLYSEVREKKLRIAPFEKDFKEASAALKKANDVVAEAEGIVSKANDRLKSALTIRKHWKTLLEETSAALDELEKPENRRNELNHDAIEDKKKEFSNALSEFREACTKLPSIEQALAEASASLREKEEQASLISNQRERANRALQRNRARIVELQKNRDQKTTTRRTFRLPQLIERGEEKLNAQNLTAASLAAATASAPPSGSMVPQRKQKTPKIEPPLLLDKVYETIGRSLLLAGERGKI